MLKSFRNAMQLHLWMFQSITFVFQSCICGGNVAQLQKWFLQMCVSCIGAYCYIVCPGNTVAILTHMYVYVSCITVRSLTTFSRWSTHTTAWVCGHVVSWGGVTLLVMCVTMQLVAELSNQIGRGMWHSYHLTFTCMVIDEVWSSQDL